MKERPIITKEEASCLTQSRQICSSSKYVCTDNRLEPQPTLDPQSEAGAVAEIITQSCRRLETLSVSQRGTSAERGGEAADQ